METKADDTTVVSIVNSVSSIAIFTPITTRCLEIVAAYLDEIHEPTHVYTLPGKRLIQSIAPFTLDRPITLEIIPINERDILDWQNSIQYIVYKSDKLVFFIPPGTRVIHRKTADRKQGYASQFAVQFGRPIERIYVEDVPTAHGKYYRIPAAPVAIQLHLPFFDEAPKSPHPPLPPIRPTTSIPYMPPPKLTVPRWWKRNQLPPQSKRWIEANLFAPIEAALEQQGHKVLGHKADETRPWTTAIVRTQKEDNAVWAAFTLPNAIPARLSALRREFEGSGQLLLCTYRPLTSEETPFWQGQEALLVIEFPSELMSTIREYEDWLNFPTKLTLNSSRYYLPTEYTAALGPDKQWELKHMHPLIISEFEAQKVPYARHVPLGSYYADFIVSAEAHTEILECKRHPFQYNLRDGIEQLLLYKELYRRLFPTRAKRELKLTLVLPDGTISAQVTETALTQRVEIKALGCDPLQTDMIAKKHLSVRVNKLAQQIMQRTTCF